MIKKQEALPFKIYKPRNNSNLFLLLKDSVQDILNSRFLAFQLAKRDISAQYRQSFLGTIWAFAPAIATAAVWIFLNSSGTITLAETKVPYPIYVFAGTLLWSIITESINSPTINTLASKNIMTKVNFPKEALIISGILKLLFNSSIKVVLLVILIFVYGINFGWGIFLFPLAVLGAVIVGTTIGLFLTPFGMLYKDVGKIISFGMQFLMYLTPVVYVVPKSGMMKTLMELNPLTPIISISRDLILDLPIVYLNYYICVIGICIPLFFAALVFYRLSLPIFTERLSA